MALTLKEARKKVGMTQVELCRKAGIHQSDLSNYERNHLVPPQKIRKNIKDVLGVDAIDWYGGGDLNEVEVCQMCDTIKVVSRRIGYRKALELLASLPPDSIRAYVASVGPGEPLLPPGVKDEEEK